MAKRLRSPDRVDGGKRPEASLRRAGRPAEWVQHPQGRRRRRRRGSRRPSAAPPRLPGRGLQGRAGRRPRQQDPGPVAADGGRAAHDPRRRVRHRYRQAGRRPPAPGRAADHALREGGLHCLELVLDEALPSGAEDSEAEELQEHRWAWTRVSSPLRLPGCDGDIPEEEDEPIEITSYALHPDGRTIFVPAHATRRGGYAGTFSLDTAVGGGDAEWTPRGEWLLPFQGQGHYDAGLDAWVGLHSPGYLCACDVPAPLAARRSGDAPRQPTWELVNAASLLYADPDPKMSDSATWLACMGGGQFCVVESMALAKQEDAHVLLRPSRHAPP